MSEPFLAFEDALIVLGMDIADLTNYEEQLIRFLVTTTTQTIICYLGHDPRQDPEEEDTSALGWVAARLLMGWYPTASNQTTGIETQTFESVSMTFVADVGLDPFCRSILGRYRKITVM